MSLSNPDFKQITFARALALAGKLFEAGAYVKVKGRSRNAKVVRVITDINEVEWEKNRPHFIEIELDGNTFLANPAQLKRRRK